MAVSDRPSTVIFTTDDLVDFAAASGDVSPLHPSPEYCNRTPYGEPLVYGVVVALAALGRLAGAVGGRTRLTRVTAEFLNPAFCGVPLDVQCDVDVDGASG